MKQDWEMVFEQDETAFFKAIGAALGTQMAARCPRCQRGDLRFYCHDFPASKNTGRIRSKWWAWCPVCYRYASLNFTKIKDVFIYSDPLKGLSEAQLFAKANGDIISYLNDLWEDGKLLHNVVLKNR